MPPGGAQPMMVQVPLKHFLKLNRLVGELYGILEGLAMEGNLDPHLVIDPDTGREIPAAASAEEEAEEGDPNLTSLVEEEGEDPDVEFREVSLGTPT